MTNKAKKSLKKTIMKMVPAVFTAMIATALGFVALYTSPVPMIQDFGKMLTIGLIVSFIVAIFFLLPLLFTRDHFFSTMTRDRSKKKVSRTSTTMNRVFDWLTFKTIAFRSIIIPLAIGAAAFGVWVDLGADAETDVETFMPQDTKELQDIHKLRDVLGTTDQVSIIYEGKEITSYDTLILVDELTKTIAEEFEEVVVETKSITHLIRQMNDGAFPNEKKVTKQLANVPENQAKLFLNETEDKGVITVGIKHLEADPLQAFIENLRNYLDNHEQNHVATTITGKAVLDVEMVQGLTTGRYKMTLLGMGLVFFSLLLIYRHPVKALIPLLPIIFIVGWSGLTMYVLDINYTPLTATLGALIIGIGTEFTVLVMERFYEERKRGLRAVKAMQVTNNSTGKAVFISALTTIGGFSALLISDFVILNNFGMMTLINISFALLSTILLMPPILVSLDRFVKIKR